MSERITVSIPDAHYTWLNKVMKNRGWNSVQGAIRSLIEDAFRLDQKNSSVGKVEEPVALNVEGGTKEESAVQMI